ncbi:MAG TPA: M28 family metallopeptidase [Sphingobacterium sp.]|nr:M28 family metallopeptidase [Sphingobacterium sp.]
MKKRLYLLAAVSVTIGSCGDSNSTTYDTSGLDSTALSAISVDSYRAHVEVLSSDEFMGRKPFTKGDTLTINYIEEQFRSLGLQPGNGTSYFQEVPLVEVTSTPSATSLDFKGKDGVLSVKYLDECVIGSSRLDDQIDVPSTELVFVGFGIVAPEYNWNDYEGLDVKGKTVVAMVSDPGRYDNTLFKADTMTYYGRWRYKFEEAGRQGAAGILLIHETGAASYGWDVVRTGWSGPQLYLASTDKTEVVTAFEGWISNETAHSLFKIGGLDPQIMEAAKKPGFKAVPMNITTEVHIQNTFRHATSNNVIAKIEGTKRKDETIIYTAHWDHLGVGERVEGDSIYNGAIDNAAGVAALFEIAKAFHAAAIRPERTIIFIALTAEEEGLLGSGYYTANPIYPLNKTVANLNMDAFSALGETKDVSIVGIGQSEIEGYVGRSAAKFGRTVRGEKNPSSGGFYRSDHFNFVKKGVPGLFMGSGTELLSTDTAAMAERRNALEGRYHTVHDEVDQNWDFEGIIADVKLFFDIGYTMSLEKTFPQFTKKSEFRTLGEKRLAK